MTEELLEDEDNDFTKTPDFHKIHQKLISLVNPDNHRAASSVIYGHYKNWSPVKTMKYYNVSENEYEQYADMFNFKERMVKQMTGRKSKQDNIVNFLNGNVGKVVTPVQLATDVQISLPTFYNFYNANRGYFKKVKRGHFEILNPKEERVSI